MILKTYPDLKVLGLGCFVMLLIFNEGQGYAATPLAKLTVAVVSPCCVFADVEANLNHFTELIEEAAAKQARLICFPELALTSYSTNAAVLKSAEEIPGPTTKKLEVITKRLNVYVSLGMAERDGDRHYIAQVLVGPQGIWENTARIILPAASSPVGLPRGNPFLSGKLLAFALAY